MDSTVYVVDSPERVRLLTAAGFRAALPTDPIPPEAEIIILDEPPGESDQRTRASLERLAAECDVPDPAAWVVRMDDGGLSRAAELERMLAARGVRVCGVLQLPVVAWSNGDTLRETLALVESYRRSHEVPAPDAIELETVSGIKVRYVITNMAGVKAQAVPWLWPGRIPRGMITLIAGDPGVGKSTLALEVAARVTTGRAWPDGTPATGHPGDVVVLSAEDSESYTIRPRLDRHDADPGRVWTLKALGCHGAGERALTITDDLPGLAAAVRRHNATLVVIDPLSAYLSQNVDSHNDASVRTALAPLSRLAETTGAAVVAIMHLNKAADKALLFRVIGSVAFGGLARAVHTVVMHPDDTEPEHERRRRAFGPAKMNVGPWPKPLAYRLPDGRVTWEVGTLDETIQELANRASGQKPGVDDATTLAEAVALLQAMLASGPALLATILERAKVQGISRATIYRAKGVLGMPNAEPFYGPGGELLGASWRLPEASLKPEGG